MCLENSRTRFCVKGADKGFGGLERTPSILRAKERKKIRKKGTRKLLKRCEVDRLTVVKSWKKTGKHVSWFDYELCLVVEG